MNDATALVAYQIALAAAVTGSFSLSHAGIQLLVTGAGGIAVGLAMGWSQRDQRRRHATLLSEFDHDKILLHQRSNPQPPFSMG